MVKMIIIYINTGAIIVNVATVYSNVKVMFKSISFRVSAGRVCNCKNR